METTKRTTETLCQMAKGLFPNDPVAAVSITKDQITVHHRTTLAGEPLNISAKAPTVFHKSTDGSWRKFIPSKGMKPQDWELVSPASVEFQILEAMLKEQNNI